MQRAEPSFAVGPFLSGARQAYEMILTAFERGNLSEVRPFLAPPVAEAFDAVIAHQRGDEHGDRGSGRRDHAGPSADDGGDHGDREGGIKADLGIDTGDDREGDRLGDQGQRDNEARQQIGADIAEPLVAIIGKQRHGLSCGDTVRCRLMRLAGTGCPADRRPEEPPGIAPGPSGFVAV